MENLNPKNPPEKRKSLGLFPTMAQPGKLVLIIAFIVTVLMFGGVAFVLYAKTAPEDSLAVKVLKSVGIRLASDEEEVDLSVRDSSETEDLEDADSKSDPSYESSTEEEEDGDEDEDDGAEEEKEDLDDDSSGLDRMMVYTKDDQLMLMEDVVIEGSSIQIDDLESAYSEDDSLFIPNTYPKFSPDGSKVIYTTGVELKVYDLESDTATVLYTAHEPGMVDGNYYEALSRVCWKDEDEIFYVHDHVFDDVEDMQQTYSVKLLNIDSLEISDWGRFNMDTGFGGYSADPSDWLAWHFDDLLGINREMYWDGENVYLQTYQNNVVWVSIPEGGSGTVALESTVLPLTDYQDVSMSMVQTDSYESDASLESYLLDVVGSSPVNLSFMTTSLTKDGTPIYEESAHGFWNLWDDEENDYVYYTKVENATSYAEALNVEDPNPQGSYPESEIFRVDVETGEPELIDEGLSFDLF